MAQNDFLQNDFPYKDFSAGGGPDGDPRPGSAYGGDTPAPRRQGESRALMAQRHARSRRRWLLVLLLLLIAAVWGFTQLRGGGSEAVSAGERGSAPPLTEVSQISDIVVMLDAGHGGSDVGCAYDGVEEKALNLKYVLMIGERLRERGYQVLYTRERDEYVSLGARTLAANEKRPHLFVSVHCNASELENIEGIEIFYNEKQGAEELAASVNQALMSSLQAKDRGCTKGSYIVLRNTDLPAILIESGFLSNAGERARMSDEDYQEQLATAVADGVEAYINSAAEKK